MIEVQKLTHICMIAKDIDRCAEFYTTELGFKVTREVKKDNGEHFLFLSNKDIVIEFINMGDAAETGMIHHFALDIKGNLEAFVEHLRDKGVEISGAGVNYFPQKDGTTKKMVFIKGPAGENIEFFEYVPAQQ